jgi:hypothetical protein
MLSSSIHVPENSNFILLYGYISLLGVIYILYPFIRSLAIVNSAAVVTFVQLSWMYADFDSFGLMPRSAVAG